MPEVHRAKTAGFCMGVALALKKLEAETVKAGTRPIRTLGPIIHNPQVLAEYAAKGVVTAKEVDDIPEGAVVVVRAHGIPRHVEERLKTRDCAVVDATCPKVKHAQLLIGREAAKHKRLLLFGESDHPEVKGLLSYAEHGALVVDDHEAPAELAPDDGSPWFLAAQTTQDRAKYDALAESMRAKFGPDLVVLPTICDATRERQEEAVELAGRVDCMIVAGGANSGNTKRLFEVASGRCGKAYLIETVDDLPLADMLGFARIGLTAGASTPRFVVDAVEAALKNLA